MILPTQLIPYLPYLLVGIALVILCLLVVLFLTLRKARKEEPLGLTLQGEDHPKPVEKTETRQGVLARFAQARDFRTSFSRAAGVLREKVTGRDYLYHVPWYLVLGETGAGKTTLLESAGIRSSLDDRPKDFGIHQAIQWRFFLHGVLLDVYGKNFLQPDDPEPSRTSWEILLKQLQNQRPRRPIDGIVIALPCSDFLPPFARDAQALEKKAALLYDRLWRAQKVLGLTVPVYVVVTKCDAVPGFQGFCKELPEQMRQDIFGWSSPYGLAASFIPDWVDEAFDSLSSNLNRLQGEIFALHRESPQTDEVFMFPEEFQLMCAPLRIFLARALKESAYRESFYLRGIYFCGDPQTEESGRVGQDAPVGPLADEPIDPFTLQEPPASAIARRLYSASPRRPIFLTRLFEEKIFPEASVAQPISRVFYSKNRLVRGSQIVALLLVVILGCGMTIRYRQMTRTWRETLFPLLNNIAKDMHANLPTFRSGRTACRLITTMHELDMGMFHSWFLPASLASSVNDRVKLAMVPAFQQEVFAAFRSYLIARTEELLVPVPTPPPAAPLSNPSATVPETVRNYSLKDTLEFRALHSFTEKLAMLQANIDRYEILRVPRQGGQDQLQGLSNYIGCRLPQDIHFHSNPYFITVLRDAVGQPLNQQQYVGRMSEKYKALVQNYLNAWLEGNPVLSNVNGLQDQINQLLSGQASTYQDLKNLDARITLVKNLLADPSSTWISQPQLSPSDPNFKAALEPLQGATSKFFDPSLEDWVRNTAEDDFDAMKSELLSAVVVPPENLIADPPDRLHLSSAALSLQIDIENLLNLPFMAMQPQGTMATTLEQDTQLIWNPDPLNEALDLYRSYERFSSEGLRNSPIQLRTQFDHIARSQLESNMLNLIGRAQNFKSVSMPSMDVSTGSTDASEMKSFVQAEAPLAEILTAFRKLGFAGSYSNLRKLTVAQACNLLSDIDAELKSEQPYVVRDGNFFWWDGQSNPALTGFGVEDQKALAAYLAFKRERIQALSGQAEPLVLFLKGRTSQLTDSQAEVYYRWQQIADAIKAYDRKIPGNSVSVLQDFIQTGMNKFSPKQYCQGLPAGQSDTESSDFFLQRRDLLRAAIYKRCIHLADLAAYQDYMTVAKLFNSTLAGKFPFTQGNVADPSNEVDPAAIRAFYQALDAHETSMRKALSMTSRYGAARSRAIAFLDAMNDLRPLFSSLLSSSKGPPLLTVDFAPSFRVNRANEVGGNQIIDWTLKVGNQKFQDHQPVKTGRWQLGEPVSLTLEWAKNSPAVPVAEMGQSDLHVSGRQATFQYTDAWALLSLIRGHHAPITDFPELVDPHPYTLQFAVGAVKDIASTSTVSIPFPKETRVFVRLSIMQPGRKEPMSLPSFPASAPLLIWTSS